MIVRHERTGRGKMQSKNRKRKSKHPGELKENTEKISYILRKAGDGFEGKKFEICIL